MVRYRCMSVFNESKVKRGGNAESKGTVESDGHILFEYWSDEHRAANRYNTRRYHRDCWTVYSATTVREKKM
jgi:hypothetical protein